MSTPPRPDSRSRLEAQQRADRIFAFRAELDALEAEGLTLLTPEQREQVRQHHAAHLAELHRVFDIDPNAATQQMSRGMQAASFLGAVAFSLAVFSFFYRFWGNFSTSVQVLLVTLAPVVAVVGVDVADRRERSGYIAALVGLVAVACFGLQLVVIGQVFAVRPSPGGFLAWGAFGMALGYAYGLWLLYAIGVTSLGVFLADTYATLAGGHWSQGIEWPELIILAVITVFALVSLHALLRRRRAIPDVDGAARFFGLLFGLAALLSLTFSGGFSLLPFESDRIEMLYQIASVPVGVGVIVLGLRRRWRETYYLGVLFLALVLLTRYADWCWDWMPHYLFFLVLGLFAIALLFSLRTLRRRLVAGGFA